MNNAGIAAIIVTIGAINIFIKNTIISSLSFNSFLGLFISSLIL